MKLAIASQNGEVFQHFGRTPEFVIYDIQDNMIAGEELLSCDGISHSDLIGLLKEQGVDELIVGGMGAKAVDFFAQANIKVHLGVSGDVRFVIKQYLEGDLEANGSVCTEDHEHHHDENHQCQH